MRPNWFVPPALLFLSAFAFAQQDPPAQDPNAAKLDEVLNNWEKAMTSVQSIQVGCTRITLDKTFNNKETFKGMAKYLKSGLPGQGSRASLELYKDTDKGPRQDIFEKYICTGNFLYEYSPANKVIRVHELPPPKPGQVADDNLLSFLFGMKAAEAKQRYALTYVPPPATDKWYYYLKVQPKHAQDKADFTEARLVLLQSNYMPRQVWFHQPNGNEVTWDFPQMQTNVEIPLAHFQQPALPQGWQFEKMPGQSKPKVRSSGP